MMWPNNLLQAKRRIFQSCDNCSCLPFSRSVFPQSQVPHHSITAAPSSNLPQSDVLMRENERLRKELEVYVEKAARLQKVREEGGAMSCWLAEGVEVVKTVVSHQYMSEWWAVSPLGLYKLERDVTDIDTSQCFGFYDVLRVFSTFQPPPGCSCSTSSPFSFKCAGIAMKGDKCLDTEEQSVHSGLLIPPFQLRIL